MFTRRQAILGLGAGVLMSGLAAQAQSDGRMRRIGVMMQIPESDPEAQARLAALQRGLQELGWAPGRDFRIDYRGGTDPGKIRTGAADLIALNPDVILAVPNSIITELRRQTRSIPLVFVNVADPVEAGLVTSLAKPGGNATGFISNAATTIRGKWLELLKEMSPELRHVLVLFNPNSPNPTIKKVIAESARTLGLLMSSFDVNTAGDVERAIGGHARNRNPGLIATPGGPVTVHRKLIIASAARHHMPAMYPYRYYAAEGGLMSYGADVLHMWTQAASYVDRVLKGEKPGNLPVQAPTKYELVINLQTAKNLGIRVPQALLLRADEVIS